MNLLYLLTFFVISRQVVGNVPLVFLVDRDWRISEDESVGTRVARVRVSQESAHLNVTYQLEPSGDKDYTNLFHIQQNTGTVFLNKSINGRKGETGFVYVTGSSGESSGPSTKAEVRVQIIGKGENPHDNKFNGFNNQFPRPFLPVGFPTVRPPSSSPSSTVTQQQSTTFSPPTTTEKLSTTTTMSTTMMMTTEREIETSSSSSSMFVVTIPVVLISILLIIIAGIYLVKKKHTNKRPVKENRKESVVTVTDEDPPSSLTQWVGKRAESNRYESCDPISDIVDRWEFSRHHLKIIGILGEGCFGQVWRCEALNIDGKENSTVAVKTLKESAGERERSDLVSELAVMKMLDPHPNVVKLLGCCTDKDPLFVIMEYVSLGKLQSFLRSSRAEHYYGNLHGDSGSLSSKDLTRFAYQVAKGMEYLASKGIIHRDLAARNVLIDHDLTCKVADFGFARDVVDSGDVYERKSDGRLPIRWMAPEALYDNIFTTKTDVWSFGVLMWEIVTLGSTPYPGLSAGEVMRKVRDGYRLEKPDHCKRDLYNIMFYCWSDDSDKRPCFSDMVKFLGKLLFSETDYIEMDRFPEHNYYNLASVHTSGEKI